MQKDKNVKIQQVLLLAIKENVFHQLNGEDNKNDKKVLPLIDHILLEE